MKLFIEEVFNITRGLPRAIRATLEACLDTEKAFGTMDAYQIQENFMKNGVVHQKLMKEALVPINLPVSTHPFFFVFNDIIQQAVLGQSIPKNQTVNIQTMKIPILRLVDFFNFSIEDAPDNCIHVLLSKNDIWNITQTTSSLKIQIWLQMISTVSVSCYFHFIHKKNRLTGSLSQTGLISPDILLDGSLTEALFQRIQSLVQSQSNPTISFVFVLFFPPLSSLIFLFAQSFLSFHTHTFRNSFTTFGEDTWKIN